jgi:hypothetical protein
MGDSGAAGRAGALDGAGEGDGEGMVPSLSCPSPGRDAARQFLGEEDVTENTSNPPDGANTVSWRDLPRKDQLFVITLARLSEPLVQTSIQSYMFYQLKWFDPTLSDSVISGQAGILQYVLPRPPFCAPWPRQGSV